MKPNDIFQVLNEKFEFVGSFNSYTNTITYNESFDMSTIPSDVFETIRYRLPWVDVATTILQCFQILFTIVIMAGHVYWRKQPEIKSTSIKISFVILSGCLFITFTSTLQSISKIFPLPYGISMALCNIQFWLLFLGITIIAITLFFRLLRIYCFFHWASANSKHWTDYHVIFYITITTSVTLSILLVGMIIDPLRPTFRVMFLPSAIPPYYSEFAYCRGNNELLCFILLVAWIAIILLSVIILAILTRHVDIKDFKDTKKVNIFVFSVAAVFSVSYSLSHFLDAINLFVVAYILRWFMEFTIVLLCHISIFVPKFVSVFHRGHSNVPRLPYSTTPDVSQSTSLAVL